MPKAPGKVAPTTDKLTWLRQYRTKEAYKQDVTAWHQKEKCYDYALLWTFYTGTSLILLLSIVTLIILLLIWYKFPSLAIEAGLGDDALPSEVEKLFSNIALVASQITEEGYDATSALDTLDSINNTASMVVSLMGAYLDAKVQMQTINVDFTKVFILISVQIAMGGLCMVMWGCFRKQNHHYGSTVRIVAEEVFPEMFFEEPASTSPTLTSV